MLETSVLADDGQIVVLGGLLRRASLPIRKRCRCWAMRRCWEICSAMTRSRKKTNLMVFLRPTVLRSAAQANVLSNERYAFWG